MQVVGGGSELCSTATVISGPGTFIGNNVGAALETQINCAAAAEVGDVWYSWTNSGATGSQTISTCPAAGAGASADYDSLIAVYQTSCGGAMVACNDDGPGCNAGPIWESTVQFGVTAGNVYKIQIGGFDAGTGFGNYSMLIAPVATPPANDACIAPAAITGSGPHAFDNTNGTRGAEHQAEVACTQFAVAPVNADVWFAWTNPHPTGSIRVSACALGNTVDTKIGVYAPAGVGVCPAGAPLACNDDTCGLQAQVDFAGTLGLVYRIQVGTYPGGVAGDQGIGVFGGTGTFATIPTPTGPANDDCSTPGATLFGPGPHAFDTTAANTGTQGQAEPLCQSNPGGMPINNDQWFKWSAFGTGQATLNTCGGLTTVDTKIAVYGPTGGATACPTGPAIGCNDDNCALQSSLCFPVTTGVAYVIQMGTFPGAAGGTGSFGIAIGASGVTACKRDDGVSDNMLGWTVGGDMAWVQRFDLGATATVTSIQVAWGSLTFPGAGPGDGSPARVLLYEDTDVDNDPSTGLVLKQNVATLVANVDTDILNTVVVPSTVMAGVFFAGAAELHAAGQFVAVMDQTCPVGNETWFFGDNAAVPATNYANPAGSAIPIDSFLNNGFACNLLVRACTVVTSPMVKNCFPGTPGTLPCPCGQPINPAGGCANHGAGATSGAVLDATGVADVSADTLSLVTSNHRAPVQGVLNVFFSYKPGTTTPTGGIPSGAGVRCIGTGGSLKRIYTVQVFGGTISKPAMGDLSVSAQSATFAGHAIVAPETRHYFNVYRDGQAAGPCGNTATSTNLTNMGSVSWVP